RNILQDIIIADRITVRNVLQLDYDVCHKTTLQTTKPSMIKTNKIGNIRSARLLANLCRLVFFTGAENARDSSVSARSSVPAMEDKISGVSVGINAFARTKSDPSVSTPLVFCASMMVL